VVPRGISYHVQATKGAVALLANRSKSG
jgi:hypothetical protein